MAKVTKVSVSQGRTVNLGNFNSYRLDVTIEAELEEEDTGKHREVIRGLNRCAKEELERQAAEQLNAINEQRDSILALSRGGK